LYGKKHTVLVSRLARIVTRAQHMYEKGARIEHRLATAGCASRIAHRDHRVQRPAGAGGWHDVEAGGVLPNLQISALPLLFRFLKRRRASPSQPKETWLLR
jgi:hypothetical protein